MSPAKDGRYSHCWLTRRIHEFEIPACPSRAITSVDCKMGRPHAPSERFEDTFATIDDHKNDNDDDDDDDDDDDNYNELCELVRSKK